MKQAIQKAFMHNFQTMLGAHVEPVNPLLVLHVNRDTIVRDTINQVKIARLKYRQKIRFFSVVVG
jgi:hypothetical protein